MGTGAYGFGVVGTLENAGETLNVGQGTSLGTLDTGTITGGIVVDHGPGPGGGGSQPGPIFAGLTLQTSSATYTLNSDTLTNTTLTGASSLVCIDKGQGGPVVIAGGTLSGVGSVTADGLVLDGVLITGANGSGHVAIDIGAPGNGSASLEIGAGQSVSGYTLTATSAQSVLMLDSGVVLDSALLTTAPGANIDISVPNAATEAPVFGSGFTFDITSGSTSSINAYASTASLVNEGTISAAGNLLLGGTFTNMGVISTSGILSFGMGSIYNAGTIDVTAGGRLMADGNHPFANSGTIAVNGGALYISFAQFTDTGTITVNHGTLDLSGALTLADLSKIEAQASQIIIGPSSSLDLGGQTITPGQGGVPNFTLGQSSTILDGTLSILAGQSFVSEGNIAASLVNFGIIKDNFVAGFSGAISGTGTIAVSGPTRTLASARWSHRRRSSSSVKMSPSTLETHNLRAALAAHYLASRPETLSRSTVIMPFLRNLSAVQFR